MLVVSFAAAPEGAGLFELFDALEQAASTAQQTTTLIGRCAPAQFRRRFTRTG
jgi:hypothetical protein